MIREYQHKNLRTLISFPEGMEETKKNPLIIFLHGAGTRNNFNRLLNENISFKLLREHQDRGYILAAPLCEAQDWCEVMETLVSWVAELRNLPYVDTDRVYLTGLSMGGYGTWELALIHPEWFAAIMPLCGGSCPGFAVRLKNVPVRTFHGLLDKVVDPIESLQMAKAVNVCGGYAELILFPHLAHNCWETVYSTEENYDWLLGHTLFVNTEDDNLSEARYG